ncbi:hypothetical protein MNBD_GAMMA26-446 [hydrothermal vent metagenome]|uniref:Antitoxin n=1 Tax=hydrothermal vent metagenome TaxID=652676 RepID=A0A3B1ALC0_9ZZZZ
MQNMSAHEAKARFGQMLDAVQHEPVTIEKHGRAVAVVVSKEEYDDIEALKLERLRAEVQKGIDAIEGGHFTEYRTGELHKLADCIKAEGRKRATAK